VLAAKRDDELQKVEGPLLCLAGKADWLPVTNELETAEHANPQAEGPVRSGVGRRNEAVPFDQRAHEFGFNAVLERVTRKARREIRTTAHEHEVAACPMLAEHRLKTRRDAFDVAGDVVGLDLE